ncbi:MAG: response regulator [Alphaproteobacteria bacterium]|nr:response regulator [Alphaproteobacteria bacterium]
MIIGNKNNEAELIAIIPSIKSHMNEWQILNIKIVENSSLSQKEITHRFAEQYRSYEGVIYPVSDLKIMMLVRLGLVENYALMKSEIEKKIPSHCCRILLRKMSTAGLRQIQIDLTQKDASFNLSDNLFDERMRRNTNVILIADDDAFIRKSLRALLVSCGEVHEVSNGDQVFPSYLKNNPDILFLDIHMPGKTGLEVIPNIIEMDSDAFIIVLSADSQKGNVLEALEKGAAGFLTKPPAKSRIQEYLNQCITIN